MSEIGRVSHSVSSEGGEHGESYPWVRYVDEQGFAYWYNHDTHESRWDEDINISIDHNAEHTRAGGSLIPKHKKKNEKRKSKMTRKQTRHPTGFFELELSSMVYYSFLWFNIVVCETPAILVEGCLRLGFLGVMLAVSAAYYLLVHSGQRAAGHHPTGGSELKEFISVIIRDVLLTSAALLTLLIPGSLYLVYRDMTPHVAHTDPDGNVAHWILNPIPTILGHVDPRRFAIVSVFGAGTNASNALCLTNAAEESKEEESRPNGLDGWQNSCVYLPRNVLYRFQSNG